MSDASVDAALADAESGNTLVAAAKALVAATLSLRTKTVQGRQGFMTEETTQEEPKAIAAAAVQVEPIVTSKKPSLWSRIKAEVKLIEQKVENDEPAAEKVALGVIAVVTPLAITVLAIADPVAVPLVAPIAGRVQAGLAAITVAVKDASLQPTVPGIAAGIISQLAQFEAVAGIKDVKVQANIATIATELQGIGAAFLS